MNSPKNLILLQKDIKISGQVLVNGQWKSFSPFYIERLDDSYLCCGLKAVLPEDSTSVRIKAYAHYTNDKHHAAFGIKILEQVLTLQQL